MKHTTKKIGLMLGIITMTLTLFISCSGSNTPEAVAEKFLTHLSKGELEKAKKYCDANTATMIGMVETMGGEELGKKIKSESKGNNKIKIISSDIKDDTAVVTYNSSEKDDDGEIKDQTIDLKKIDGKWKVSMNKEGGK